MVIHELATNAMKHGALKVESGNVLVLTKILSHDQVQISWIETDGPEVASERILSTGISLLEGLVSHEMNGIIHLDFKKCGLHCVIEVPLNES